MKKIYDICKNIKPIHINDCNTLCYYTVFLNGGVFYFENNIPYFKESDLLFYNNKLIAIDYIENDFNINNLKNINVIDVRGKYITPSFIDEHIHGGFDINFNNASENEIRYLLKKCKDFGYSNIIATLLPDNIENINKQLNIIRKIIETPQNNTTKIYGVHLEGPFLNPQKAGIHPDYILKKPDIKEFKKITNKDIIKIVTLAPEIDKNYELCKYLNDNNIIPSAGHSVANADNIKKSNVKQVTHLFNAMAPIHHREMTIANEALFNDNLSVEIITDLKHVHPKMLNLVKKCKPLKKIIFISDALPCAYSKNKISYLNNVKINTSSGIALGEDGTIAGNNKFSSDNISNIVNKTNFTFEEIIACLSINCAKNLNIINKFEFNINNTIDFIIWDKETLKIEKIFIN